MTMIPADETLYSALLQLMHDERRCRGRLFRGVRFPRSSMHRHAVLLAWELRGIYRR